MATNTEIKTELASFTITMRLPLTRPLDEPESVDVKLTVTLVNDDNGSRIEVRTPMLSVAGVVWCTDHFTNAGEAMRFALDRAGWLAAVEEAGQDEEG